MRIVAIAVLIGLAAGAAAVFFAAPEDAPLASFAPGYTAQEGPVRYDEGRLIMPVAGVAPREIRDSFRSPRSGGRTHKAIDIFAARGTPVVALTPGEIVRVGVDGLGGNVVRLQSASGRYEFYYAHLHTFAPGLRTGQKVAQGDTLGTVGTTGNARATPPHLHFQILLHSSDGERRPLNPYSLLRYIDVGERAVDRMRRG